ncbi:MAG: M55 family metallopeptidase [Planctomycetota bacterium]|nr:M55 family metallopeptidase [Planctomycetota bacterium]
MPRTSARRPLKTVYLMTDLEGCAGVDDWDPRHADYVNTARYVDERREMQRLLTGEVNACVDGCLDAGVESVIINDAHGAGRTILVEELHPKAKIIRGKSRPTWTFALDRCDAIFHVGMHARSDTPMGTLCHTMSNSITDYRVNGVPTSEFDLSILLAGHFGIPAPFFAGEMRACAQAKEIVPNIVTVETKEGMGVLCALHIAPVEACRLIREQSAEAVAKANAGAFEPVVWKAPYKLEVQMRDETYKPEQAGPGKEWINRHTMAWYAQDLLSVFEFSVYDRQPAPKARCTPDIWKRAHKKR